MPMNLAFVMLSFRKTINFQHPVIPGCCHAWLKSGSVAHLDPRTQGQVTVGLLVYATPG